MRPAARQSSLLPRIMDLKQALFFCQNHSILKLPVSLVNVLHVDELSHIWFVINRPSQQLEQFDPTFEARLELYRKGITFHMQVTGKAFLVADPEEVTAVTSLVPSLKSVMTENVVLVRMKAEKVHYFPHRSEEDKTLRTPMFPAQRLAFFKSLQDVLKNIVPVFQSH